MPILTLSKMIDRLPSSMIEDILKGYFEERTEIKAAYLFGSVASGKDNKDSDVDIALLIEPFKNKVEGYEAKLHYRDRISMLLKKDVDIIFLHEAGELLSFEIINTGRIIFERDREANRSFLSTRLIQCLDFKPLEERMQKGMIAAMKRS